MALGAPELVAIKNLIEEALGEQPHRSIGEAIERLRREEVPKMRQPRKALSHLRAVETFCGDRPLGELEEAAVDYRLAHSHLAVATCNRRASWLRRMGYLAYRRWRWLARPPHIELHREHNERQRYLSLEEVEQLLAACDHEPTRDAVALAVYTGMRQSEIFRLRPEDVREGCFLLPRTKNGGAHLIPIVPQLREVIGRLPLGCHPRWMYTHFKRACERAGLEDLRFHDLRHTTASLLINRGYTLKLVGEILGHRSLQATNRYAHLAVSTQRAALFDVFGAAPACRLER